MIIIIILYFSIILGVLGEEDEHGFLYSSIYDAHFCGG